MHDWCAATPYTLISARKTELQDEIEGCLFVTLTVFEGPEVRRNMQSGIVYH